MDLAKIRKKSLLTQIEPNEVTSAAIPAPLPEMLESMRESVQIAVTPDNREFSQREPYTIPVAPTVQTARLVTGVPLEVVDSSHTPLEAILAGRTAAGCDDESILADDVTTEIVAESSLEFLCFRVSDEIYGINIMDIKEIIKPREVTDIPRAPVFVLGVLSLRGTIIPIIDMRVRLGLVLEKPTGKERIIVIKNNNSFSGLLVDEVIKVVSVQLDSVEAAPAVLDGIDRDFVSGLGRSDGRLIIVLNLENIADIDLY